jgi:hypothetical protein
MYLYDDGRVGLIPLSDSDNDARRTARKAVERWDPPASAVGNPVTLAAACLTPERLLVLQTLLSLRSGHFVVQSMHLYSPGGGGHPVVAEVVYHIDAGRLRLHLYSPYEYVPGKPARVLYTLPLHPRGPTPLLRQIRELVGAHLGHVGELRVGVRAWPGTPIRFLIDTPPADEPKAQVQAQVTATTQETK